MIEEMLFCIEVFVMCLYTTGLSLCRDVGYGVERDETSISASRIDYPKPTSIFKERQKPRV
jgi:hypothetical protein